MSHLKNVKREADVIIPEAGEKYVGKDGTVSKVLDDFVDRDYEPTQQEINEFAEFIGMELPEDEEFLYIARNALKTPLPKEWKPCQTDENEIYYFNFKTGESRWEHPMDDIARRTFEGEKKRIQELRAEGKLPPKTAGASNGIKTPAGASALHTSHSVLNTSSSNNSLNSSATRTIFTSDGILHKEPGKVIPTAGVTNSSSKVAPTSTVSTKAKASVPAGTSGGTNASVGNNITAGAAMKKQMVSSTVISSSLPSSAGTTGAKGNTGPQASNRPTTVISMKDTTKTTPLASSTTSNKTTLSTAPAALGSAKLATTTSQSASSSSPLRSEAENQIEEKIRREVAQDIQMKRDAHEKEMNEKLRVLRESYNQKTKQVRDSDTENRRIWREEQQEKADRALQEARQKFQTQYGDDLHELERRAEHLKLELARVQKSGNRQEEVDKVQRDVAEREAAADLSEMLSQLTLDMETEQKKKQREKEIGFLVRKKEKEKESEEMMSRVQDEARKIQEEKANRAKKEAEDRQKKLEQERKVLELQVETLKSSNARLSGNNSLVGGTPNRSTISSMSNSPISSPNTSAAGRPGQDTQEDVEAQIKMINQRRDERIEKLRADAKKEQNTVRTGKQLEMDKLHYLISQAKKTKEATEKAKTTAEAAVAAAAVANAATKKTESKNAPAEEEKKAITQLLEQERAKIKKRVEADEMLRIDGLKRERESRLKAIVPPASTVTTQRSPSPTVRDMERVAKECEEELNNKKALYKKLEDDLCEQLAKELEMKEEQDESKRLQETVAQEMERYTTDVLSRRDRLQKEYELRKEKHANQLAQMKEEAKAAALERRAAEVEARVAIAVEAKKKEKQIEADREDDKIVRETKEQKKKESEEQQQEALRRSLKEEEDAAVRKVKEEVDEFQDNTLKRMDEKIKQLIDEKDKAEEEVHSLPGDSGSVTTVDPKLEVEAQLLEKKVLEMEALHDQLLRSPSSHPETAGAPSMGGTTTIIKKINTPYYTSNGDYWIKRADHQSHLHEVESFYAQQQSHLKQQIQKLEEYISLASIGPNGNGSAIQHGRSTTPHTPILSETGNLGFPAHHSLTMTPPSTAGTTGITPRKKHDAFEDHSPSATSPGRGVRGATPSPSRAPSQHSSNDSLHTSDALRFLQVQQKESTRRKDALKEAKREWQQDVQDFFASPQGLEGVSRAGGPVSLYVDPNNTPYTSRSPKHHRHLSNGSGLGSHFLTNDVSRTADSLLLNETQNNNTVSTMRYPGSSFDGAKKSIYELEGSSLHLPIRNGSQSAIGNGSSVMPVYASGANVSGTMNNNSSLLHPYGSVSSLPFYSTLYQTPNASILLGPGQAPFVAPGSSNVPIPTDDSIGSALLRLNYRLDVLTHQANYLAQQRMERHTKHRRSATHEVGPLKENPRASRYSSKEKRARTAQTSHQHRTHHRRSGNRHSRSEVSRSRRVHQSPQRDHYDSCLHHETDDGMAVRKTYPTTKDRRGRVSHSALPQRMSSRNRGTTTTQYDSTLLGPGDTHPVHQHVRPSQNRHQRHGGNISGYPAVYSHGSDMVMRHAGTETTSSSMKEHIRKKWNSRLLDLSSW